MRLPLAILCLAWLAGCADAGRPSGPANSPDQDADSAGGGPDAASVPGGADAASVPPDATGADREAERTPDSAPLALDGAPDGAPDLAPAPDGPPPGSPYNPCPPKGKPCVALPLGDSLTQGAGSSGGGYRRELFRQAVRHGQSVTFVGSAASGPATLEGVPFPRAHEGHGGFTIQNLAAWLTEHNTIATYKPDIVMLEIGTNNGLRHPGANVPAALNALGAIIDQILAADAHLLLIVAQITPNKTDVGVAQIQAFNKGIPALVAARAAAGKHIAVVDIYKFFVANPDWKTEYLPTSDVHPVDAGYDAMGTGWYSALGPLLR